MSERHADQRFLTNVIWNFLGQLVPGIVMVVAIPTIVRNLGDQRFGILSLAWALFGYLSLLDFGLSRALTHSISVKLGNGRKDDISVEIFSAISALFIIAIFIGLGIFVFRDQISQSLFSGAMISQQETDLSLLWLILASIPTLISIGLKGALEGLGRFDYSSYIKAPLAVATYGIPAVISIFSSRLDFCILLLVISRVVSVGLYVLAIHKDGIRLVATISKDSICRLFTFGGWLAVSNVLSPILYQIDRFYIGLVLGASAVTYYTVPLELATKLLFIPTAVLAVTFPSIAAKKTLEPDRVGKLLSRSIHLVMVPVTILCSSFILFSNELLNFWVGPEMAVKATLILQILTAGILINSLAQVYFTLIQSWGLPKITTQFHLIQIPIFLLMYYVLVERFGIQGAAGAWTIRVLIDALMLAGYSNKLNTGNGAIQKTGLAVVICAALIGLGIYANIYAKIIAFTVELCMLLAWALFSKSFQDERTEIKGVLAKLGLVGKST